MPKTTPNENASISRRESLKAIAAAVAMAAPAPASARPDAPERPLNVLLIIRDQMRFDLPVAEGFRMPAMDRLAGKGITFRNHYIASAMCSPSRGAFWSGHPPQVNGIIDQMEMPYVPGLRTDQPNMGSMMKKLGYATALFGKWEMDRTLMGAAAPANTSTALRAYGFDAYQPDGDKTGGPNQGYKTDGYTASESVRWLRGNVPALRKSGQPFFLVVSLINPHDIMYADANVPGTAAAQQGVTESALTAPPENALYSTRWNAAASPTLHESLAAKGMPAALTDYKVGWDAALGEIPVDRPDMWQRFHDYYLNLIRDTDETLQQVTDGLDELDLWRDTVVIVTSDHGEMAGDHGGLRGKGPFAYEGNSHVPLTIVHPNHAGGKSCAALTSHLDLMPSLPGLARVPKAPLRAAIQGLPGCDFSGVLATAATAEPDAVRPGVLFNYVGPMTIDSGYLFAVMKALLEFTPRPPVTQLQPKLDKRGFMSFAFDGRYKFVRYYAPAQFNTPTTIDHILRDNDVQLFDLREDPHETRNLALVPDAHEALILRMNALLNDLIAREVGKNDGAFLPEAIRPKA